MKSMKTENNKIIICCIVCRADLFEQKVDGRSQRSSRRSTWRKEIGIITHSNIHPKRHLNKSRLNLNNTGISVLLRDFKTFLTNFNWKEYKDSVSDNFLFVIGDSVSSNDINRMKKQRLDNINNAIIGQLNVNSFRNKFVFVGDIINLFDALLVSESKLGHTFKNKNFNFFLKLWLGHTYGRFLSLQ